MTRKSRFSISDETITEMEAEDALVRFLGGFPDTVAIVTAVKTALLLAMVWEIERQEMLARNEDPLVYHTTDQQRGWMSAAFARYSLEPLWLNCPDRSARSLLSHLTPDAAAWVAFKVARSELGRKELT
jgi:hypothetical protein